MTEGKDFHLTLSNQVKSPTSRSACCYCGTPTSGGVTGNDSLIVGECFHLSAVLPHNRHVN